MESNNPQCICAVADVHLNTMGLNVRTRSQITVQIRRQLCSRAQENVSVKNLFVLATKLAVTRITRLTTTVEVRDCLETERPRYISFQHIFLVLVKDKFVKKSRFKKVLILREKRVKYIRFSVPLSLPLTFYGI